ncbi:MAG: hypothetical protein GF409_05240 [Candidatus Omnitrophica bacterium]|nr:hypothetical protein [Candidatus Omnitrophota bacterium]
MKRVLVGLVSFMVIAGMCAMSQAAGEDIDVISLAGDVRVIPRGEKQSVPCRPGMKLGEGARIMTGDESYAEIALDTSGMNMMKVKANTTVVLVLEGEDKIHLVDGEIYTVLDKIEPGETFRVRTPCATCGARGTGWRTVTTEEESEVSVFDGRVFVRGVRKDGTAMERQYWVRDGYERKVKRFEKPSRLSRISARRLDAMRREVRRRSAEQRPAKPEKKAKPEVSAEKSERSLRSDPGKRMIRRQERIERRIEKKEDVREQRRESIMIRKDDSKVESNIDDRRTIQSTDSSDSRSIGP